VLNTYQLATLRYATRGGAVRVLSAPPAWRPVNRAVRPLIKLLLFCCSFVISNSVFFAIYFGPQSCFFSRTGGRVGFGWAGGWMLGEGCLAESVCTALLGFAMGQPS
jgi:hypothetical protein